MYRNGEMHQLLGGNTMEQQSTVKCNNSNKTNDDEKKWHINESVLFSVCFLV